MNKVHFFKVLVLVVLGFGLLGFTCPLSASAQTWAEFFSQKKTQKSYLMQQIAALQVYIGYAKKGYDIVSTGVNTVKDISNGEFGLHKAFFASLASVNPSVKNSPAVAEILDNGLALVGLVSGWKSSELLAEDWIYVSLVKGHLLALCATDLEDMVSLLTSGKLSLSDDERLRRLEGLRVSVSEKYVFAVAFSRDIGLMIRTRKAEQDAVKAVRGLYGIE